MANEKLKIELDEQVQLADCSNWIFEKSAQKNCIRAIKLGKDGDGEFVIDEIHDMRVQELQHLIEQATGSLVKF